MSVVNYKPYIVDFDSPDRIGTDQNGNADIIHLAKELGKNKALSEEEAAKIAASKIAETEHHNSMWYRIHATRALTGGHRLIPKVNNAFKDVGDNMTFVFHQTNANSFVCQTPLSIYSNNIGDKICKQSSLKREDVLAIHI